MSAIKNGIGMNGKNGKKVIKTRNGTQDAKKINWEYIPLYGNTYDDITDFAKI